MKTPTPTTEATKRPWEQLDTLVLGEFNGHTDNIAQCGNRHDGSALANAALICKAVNEYEALCKVAEAAETLRLNVNGILSNISMYGHESLDIAVRDTQKKLKEAFQTLATLRNPTPEQCDKGKE